MTSQPHQDLRLGEHQWQAVDGLVECWSNWDLSRSYYLDVLLPQVVRRGVAAGGTDRERSAIQQLKDVLDQRQWSELAALVDTRQMSVLERKRKANADVVEASRLRRTAQAQEHARSLAEQKKFKARQLRKAEESLTLSRLQANKKALAEAKVRRTQRETRAAAAEQKLRDEATRTPLLKSLRIEFEQRYLESASWLAAQPNAQLIPHKEFRAEQAAFVARWSLVHANLKLDHQQALAVSAVGGHFKVAARAGSGKTRTLVARALFLQLHCGIPADQIMLLAFNREAAEQLRDKIGAKLPGKGIPFCLTFHALAYALVYPEEGILFDGGDLHREQSRLLQRCIDELIRSPIYHFKVRSVMLSYFQEDWTRLTQRGDHLNAAEGMEVRRHLERETLRGDFVKSQGERVIANALFEHGVAYQYERSHDWKGSPYRPDFTVLVNGKVAAVIEYFGMQGDRDYDRTTQKKLKYWESRPNVLFFPLYPADVVDCGSATATAALLEKLRVLGLPYEKLSDEELWKLVKERAIDRFTTTARNLVDRARQRRWDYKRLRRELDMMDIDSGPIRKFVKLGAEVLKRYEESLVQNGKEDFTGLLWRGVDELSQGNSRFGRSHSKQSGDVQNLRHILIDEFQDFSQMFAQLTQNMSRNAPNAEVFAVGDDWQAINEFAGSDLKYFNSFASDFKGGEELTISTNYRSACAVVDRGNLIMQNWGTPAKAGSQESGWVSACDSSEFTQTLFERKNFGSDLTTPLLIRILTNLVQSGKEVTLLTRRKRVWWVYPSKGRKPVNNIEQYLAYLHSWLPREAKDLVKISTAHAYKGQEADVIIVLNADAKNFPIIHPTFELFGVFGDTYSSVLDAERRLFYVATTRAKERLLYLHESSRAMSEFLVESQAVHPLTSQDPNSFSPTHSGNDIEIRVYVKNDESGRLKNAGMRFDWRGLCWATSRSGTNFDPKSIERESWYRPTLRIEIRRDNNDLIAEMAPTKVLPGQDRPAPF